MRKDKGREEGGRSGRYLPLDGSPAQLRAAALLGGSGCSREGCAAGRERLLQGGRRCWAGAAPPGREALLGSCISGGAAEASAGKARRGGGLAVVEAGHGPVQIEGGEASLPSPWPCPGRLRVVAPEDAKVE